MRHFGVAASTDCSNHTIKTAVRGIVDDPAAHLIFVDFLHGRIEFGLLLQAVALPELLDLGDDCFAVWVAIIPPHARMEAIHETVDLQTGSVVHFGPDAAHTVAAPSLKDLDVKSMADAVRSR